MSGATVALALGSTILPGVAFSALPAARAARLDPVGALKAA